MNGAYSVHANMFASLLWTHVALGFVQLCCVIREKVVGGSANGSGRCLLDTLLRLI